jgi:hypothetical protein
MKDDFLKRYSRFSEYLWLVVGIVCLFSSIYFLAFTQKQEEAFILLMFTALSSGMYGMRRVFRRRMERINREQEEAAKKSKK